MIVAPFGIRDRIVYQQDIRGQTSTATDTDDSGNGTAVAGVIAEMAPGVELIILKATYGTINGVGDPISLATPYIVNALNWVVEHFESDDFNIVAVQLGFTDPTAVYTEPQVEGTDFIDALDEPLENLFNAGVPVIAHSGNLFRSLNSAEGLTYPAASPWVISAAGVWDKNEGAQSGFGEEQHTAPDQIMAYTN